MSTRGDASSTTVRCRTDRSPRLGSTLAMYSRKARFGPTTSTPSRASRRRCSNRRYAARCRPTAVLPVPGPPWTIRQPSSGARMTMSCSAWMVATISRIAPVRAAPISASTGSGMPLAPSWASGSSRCSSRYAVISVTPPSPVGTSGRPIGSLVARPQREAAAEAEPERVGHRRPVERRRDRRPPVHDDRVVLGGLDVTTADVPAVAALLVDASEEVTRPGHAQIGERVGHGHLDVLLRDLVRGAIRIHGGEPFDHRVPAGARERQIVAFLIELGEEGRVSGHRIRGGPQGSAIVATPRMARATNYPYASGHGAGHHSRRRFRERRGDDR